MASQRFGATPARLYATKVRWLMGGMVSLVVVLVGVIVCILTAVPGSTKAVAEASTPTTQEQRQSVGVAFALRRVETGARIEAADFKVEQLPVALVPIGGVNESELPELVGTYATKLISPGLPLLRTDLSSQPPTSTLPIPKGFRAATILVDQREGVDGYPEPNSRVDVLWSYTDRGAPKVGTLVHFAKVLSVAGNPTARGRTPQSGPMTVTLLVTKTDAKRIELARTVGKLSLSLLGQDAIEDDNEPGTVGIPQLIGDPQPTEEVAAPEYSGVAIITDPITGRQIRFVSDGQRWSRDARF